MQEAFDLLQGILESTTDATVSVGPDYRLSAMNQAFRNRMEARLGRIPNVGDELATILGNTRDAMDRWQRAIGGEEVSIREEFVAGDGARKVFDLRYYPIRGSAGSVIGAMEISRDVTEQAEADTHREILVRELEEERRKLQKFFQLAPAFIAVLRGPDFVFEYVNDAYYALVGHRPILGLPLAVAVPEAVGGGEGKDYDRLLAEILAAGTPRTFSERPVKLQPEPTGPIVDRYLDLVYQPLHEADGKVSGILVHGVDVTESVLSRASASRLTESLQRQTALWDVAPVEHRGLCLGIRYRGSISVRESDAT